MHTTLVRTVCIQNTYSLVSIREHVWILVVQLATTRSIHSMHSIFLAMHTMDTTLVRARTLEYDSSCMY